MIATTAEPVMPEHQIHIEAGLILSIGGLDITRELA